jgi:hypothetical protein
VLDAVIPVTVGASSLSTIVPVALTAPSTEPATGRGVQTHENPLVDNEQQRKLVVRAQPVNNTLQGL